MSVGARPAGVAALLFAASSLLACGADPPYKSTYQGPSDAKVQVPIRLVWENEMGAGFQPEELTVTVDGGKMVELTKQKTDGTDALDQAKLEIWSAKVYTTPHVLHTKVVYRGHGYGVFAYMSKFTFAAEEDHTSFPRSPGLVVRIVGYEKGTPTTPLEDRPAIRYIDEPMGDP